MVTILVLILAFPFSGAAASQHCPGVRSLPVKAACREACGTRLLYDMCMDTLLHEDFHPAPSKPVEVSMYAVVAAQHALESYVATMDAASELLNGSLGADERVACQACVEDYSYAEGSMYRVASRMLPWCRFGDLVGEYMNAIVHLESCRTRLISLGASQLYARNLVDRNKALLAYSLAKLLGI